MLSAVKCTIYGVPDTIQINSFKPHINPRRQVLLWSPFSTKKRYKRLGKLPTLPPLVNGRGRIQTQAVSRIYFLKH